ncbi:unnamed protein product, partial [Choristocarpus tenellus]
LKVGSRLIDVTNGRFGGHRVFPLVLHAQRRLCSRAASLLKDRTARLEALDRDFENAQAQRIKRKVRKAIETKSYEEIEHERARQPLLDTVGDARVRKQVHDHRLGTLAQRRDSYFKTKKITHGQIDDARTSLAEYLELRAFSFSSSSEYGDGGESSVAEDEAGSLHLLEHTYTRAVAILREKGERDVLCEALCDLGDLHVRLGGGRYDLASQSWADAIDSLCSALDATKHWRILFQRYRSAKGCLANTLGGWGCLAGAIILGKLSAHCSQNNLGGQLELSLMAAELFHAPFEMSMSFPQRICDFVSFTPEQLDIPGMGILGFQDNERRLSISSLCSSISHVCDVLVAEGKGVEALPALALLEYLTSKVTLEPLHLIRARLKRVQCLAEAGFPAGAVSALASVLRGGGLPETTGFYTGLSPNPPAPAKEEVLASKGSKDKGAKAQKGKGKGKGKGEGGGGGKKKGRPSTKGDLSSEGIPFFGLAPYYDHLPLDHPDNAQAIAWLLGEDIESGAGSDTGSGGGSVGETSGRFTKRPNIPLCETRAAGLLKLCLSHLVPSQLKLLGEEEAFLIAQARVQILFMLTMSCSAIDGIGQSCEGNGNGGSAVTQKVRGAADAMMGEILQLFVMRVTSPPPTILPPHEGDSQEKDASSGSEPPSTPNTSAAAPSGTMTSTPTEAWAVGIAANVLLLRGRLALQDGKLRVCRHHASRALAILLRHGLDLHSMATATTSAHAEGILFGHGAENGEGGSGVYFSRSTAPIAGDGMTGGTPTRSGQGLPPLRSPDDLPWKVVLLWLELRHDLATVALLQ